MNGRTMSVDQMEPLLPPHCPAHLTHPMNKNGRKGPLLPIAQHPTQNAPMDSRPESEYPNPYRRRADTSTTHPPMPARPVTRVLAKRHPGLATAPCTNPCRGIPNREPVMPRINPRFRATRPTQSQGLTRHPNPRCRQPTAIEKRGRAAAMRIPPSGCSMKRAQFAQGNGNEL